MKLPRILSPSTWNWDAIYARLQNFPTVNARALSLTALDYQTFYFMAAFCVVVEIMKWRITEGILSFWAGWLVFLGGCHGFSFGAYNVKRKTSSDHNADEDTEPIVPPRDQRPPEVKNHG